MKKGHIIILVNKIVYFESNDSKQLIKVTNETRPVERSFTLFWILLIKEWYVVKNNHACSAVIKENKATIVKIIR